MSSVGEFPLVCKLAYVADSANFVAGGEDCLVGGGYGDK